MLTFVDGIFEVRSQYRLINMIWLIATCSMLWLYDYIVKKCQFESLLDSIREVFVKFYVQCLKRFVWIWWYQDIICCKGYIIFSSSSTHSHIPLYVLFGFIPRLLNILASIWYHSYPASIVPWILLIVCILNSLWPVCFTILCFEKRKWNYSR